MLEYSLKPPSSASGTRTLTESGLNLLAGIAVTLLFAIVFGTASARACDRPGLEIDNDVTLFKDRGYTSGIRGGCEFWLKAGTSGAERQFEATIGQQLYTPSNLNRDDIDESDRPYAGHLFGQLNYVEASDRRLDRIGLQIGVIGPPALGEDTQKATHRLTGYTKPQGWDNQLDTEPAINIHGARAWRVEFARSAGSMGHDLIPYATAALGNVLTAASGGVAWRFGSMRDVSFLPPGEATMPPGYRGRHSEDREFFGFLGGDARFVLQDLFLDGNTFEDSHSVDKNHIVGTLRAGFVLQLRQWSVSFTQNVNTPLYSGDRIDGFGSLRVSKLF